MSDLRFKGSAMSSGVGNLRQLQTSSYLKPTALQDTFALSGNYVKLDTGEIVSRNDYNTLTPEQQETLKTQGVEKFNESEQTKVNQILEGLVKLDTGEYVSKEAFEALPSDKQSELQSIGITAFNQQENAKLEAFKSANVQLDNGEWLSADTYNLLSTTDQQYIKTNGIDAYNNKIQQDLKANYVELPNGEYVDKTLYEALSTQDKKSLNSMGIDDFNTYKQKEQQKSDTQYINSIAAINAQIKQNEATIARFPERAVALKAQNEQLRQQISQLTGMLSSGAQIDINAIIAGQSSQIPNVIHLSDGSSVPNSVWQDMSPEQRQILMDRGIDGYNQAVQSGEIQNAMLQSWVNDLPEGSQGKIAYDYAISSGNSPEKAAQYAAQYVNALIATAQPVEAQVLDYVRSQPEGSDIKIAYNYALESGNSPEKAAQYAVNYAETMFITSPEGIQAQKVAAIIADLTTDENGAPKVVDLNEATQRLRAENIIDDTMEVTGYGGNGFTISRVKVETPQGTVLQPIIEYFDANPTKIDSGDSVSDLLAQGFTLQQIADASAAYRQVLKYREQKEALAKLNSSIEGLKYTTEAGDLSSLTQEQLDEISIREAKGLSVDYYPIYTGEALALFIRNNPDDGVDILQRAGFSNNDINAIVRLSEQPYDDAVGFYREGTAPNVGEYIVGYVSDLFPDVDTDDIRVLSGLFSAQDNVDKGLNIFGFKTGLFPNNDEILAKYSTKEGKLKANAISKAIIEAQNEYSNKYGGENILASELAVVGSMVFAPARAIAPDVTIKDISGAEWALGVGQVLSYAALPYGGIIGGVIGKALDIGASAAFAVNTALKWDDPNFTIGQKIWEIGGNLAFLVLPYAISRFSEGAAIARAAKNPETRALINDASKAGAAARKAELLGKAAKAQGLLDGNALYASELGSRLQTARAEANMYTRRFIESLSRLDDIDPSLLKILEQDSGIKGLTKVTQELGDAAKKLRVAQDNLSGTQQSLFGDIKGKVGQGGRVVGDATVGQSEVIKAQNALTRAQAKFDIAMGKYADTFINPRFEVGEGSIPATKVITSGEATIDDIEKLFTENYKASIENTLDDISVNLARERKTSIESIDDILGREKKGGNIKDGYIYKNNGYWRRFDPLTDSPLATTITDPKTGRWVKVSAEEALKPDSGGIAIAEKVKANAPDISGASGGIKKEAQVETPKTSSGADGAKQKVFVTKRDEQELYNLNYPQEVINKMTPQEVYDAIEKGILYSPKNSIISSSLLRSVATPIVISDMSNNYNINIDSNMGISPISTLELETIAMKLGMTDGEIQTLENMGALPESIIYKAIETLPSTQSMILTQAIVSSYPHIMPKVATIPQVKEWQQIRTREILDVESLQSLAIDPMVVPLAEILEKVDTTPSISTQPAIKSSIETEPAIETAPLLGDKIDIYKAVGEDIPTPKTIEEVVLTEKLKTRRLTKKEEKRLKTLKKEREFKGAIAWAQGFGWVAIKKPYRQEDVAFFYGEMPPAGITPVIGGKGEAYRSIQQYLIDNDLPDIHIRRGIMKIDIVKPTKEPGAVGAITFTPTQSGDKILDGDGFVSNDVKIQKADLSDLGTEIWEDEEPSVVSPRIESAPEQDIRQVIQPIKAKKIKSEDIGFELR